MFLFLNDIILLKSQIMKVQKVSWSNCIYIYSIRGHCTEIKVNSQAELDAKFEEIKNLLKEGNK